MTVLGPPRLYIPALKKSGPEVHTELHISRETKTRAPANEEGSAILLASGTGKTSLNSEVDEFRLQTVYIRVFATLFASSLYNTNKYIAGTSFFIATLSYDNYSSHYRQRETQFLNKIQ